MAASYETRHHEAAHAVAAYVLGIVLGEEGMILNSDQDASVVFDDTPKLATNEQWFINRAAVKLAGPVAMCLRRGEPLEWATLKQSPEYCGDFEEARKIFRCYWARNDQVGSDEQIEEQMSNAATISIECVRDNNAAIISVAKMAEGKDRLPRNDIVNAIRRI